MAENVLDRFARQQSAWPTKEEAANRRPPSGQREGGLPSLAPENLQEHHLLFDYTNGINRLSASALAGRKGALRPGTIAPRASEQASALASAEG